MGSPDFAVASLKALVEAEYDIVGVITAVDKPSGRGKKFRSTAVKAYAQEQGLRILQPPNLKSKKFLKELKSLNADLQIVVAFRMLPALVFEMPPKGTINLHASLLPDYRGAAPINWAIIDGQSKTGLTTFYIEQEIDTGKILLQEELTIEPEDDVGTLHDKMMIQGADLVVRTVRGIEDDSIEPFAQEFRDDLNDAPKIFKDDCEIDWTLSSFDAHNFIRGMSPFPGAYTYFLGERVKIFKTDILDPESVDEDMEAGDVSTDNSSFLRVGTADGALDIMELQLAGKRRMKIKELLNGYRFGGEEEE